MIRVLGVLLALSGVAQAADWDNRLVNPHPEDVQKLIRK